MTLRYGDLHNSPHWKLHRTFSVTIFIETAVHVYVSRWHALFHGASKPPSQPRTLTCGWAGLKGGISWGMEFREKGTFKSETRFAPLLILSRRLVSVSADSEKLRFEPAHISHDPLARPVGAQNPSPSSVSYIIMSLVHSYQPEFTLYLHKSLRMACNRPKQSILLTVNIWRSCDEKWP